MKHTNQHVAEIATSVKFASFLQEGLGFVDMWTPTQVNSGGCGIFAYELAKELEKYGIPYKIELLFDNDDKDNQDMDVIKSYLDTFFTTGKIDNRKVGISHVMLFIEDTLYVDSNGLANIQAIIGYNKLEVSLENLKKCNDYIDLWNITFDRTCIPVIRERLDEIFTHLVDFHSGMFAYPGRREIRYTPSTMKGIKKMEERKKFSSINGLLELLKS